MKFTINLSCEGRQENGFKFCSGAENTILDLDEIINSEDYLKMLDYLDKVTKVFNKPCYTSNIISNALYKMYELNYFSEEQYKNISYFYRMHEVCGLILKCLPK